MLSEYQTQNTLNPKLWVGAKLKPKLHESFMKIANHFYDFLEINAPILDVIIIGSNANYNWTEFSDIDLHVVINYLEVGNNVHLVNDFLHAKKSIWNSNYPLTYNGINIELYAQDSNANLHASVGIYSVMQQKWLHQPNSEIVSIDDDAIQQKADPLKYEIDKLKQKDPELESKIKDILVRLNRMRKAGLVASGEYSIENLAFKYLRNTGRIERLKELLHFNTMKQLSIDPMLHEVNAPTGGVVDNVSKEIVESLVLHVTKQKTLDDTGWANIIKHTKAVEDPMGQWKHPGKCTMIPSNNITMQQVNYPVIGIDDTGHIKMMHPEKTYTYPGTKVFEIPHTPQWQTLLIQLKNSIRNGSRYAK